MLWKKEKTSCHFYYSAQAEGRGPSLKAWLNEETLLRKQMFLRLAARETYVSEANPASRKHENVSETFQKHLCFPDASFVSETYVSSFSHGGNNVC